MWRDRSEDSEDDIAFFLAEETDENIARGMTPEVARRAARKKFGNLLRAREEMRAVWVPRWLDDAAHDARYAWRTYTRSKMFTVTVLLLIALGIGVNTAVFSLVDALLLRPLPYPDGDRLVAYSDEGKPARFKAGISAGDFAVWRERVRSLDALAGYQYQDATVSAADDAMTVQTATAAGDFWPLLGVQPHFGRLFAENAAAGEVVLSYRLFARLLAADPTAIGKPIVLNGAPVTVAGVLPPTFRFLLPQGQAGLELREPDVFQPAGPLLSGDRRRLSVVGRLRGTATAGQALAEIRQLQASLQTEAPDRWFAGVDWMQLPLLRESLVGRAARALTILQIAGLLVLLVACTNVAGLLLARGMARQRELAIRAAIGAGRGRLLRQCLCEGLFLAMAGGGGGVLLAQLLSEAMHRWGTETLPRLAEAGMDGRVLAFAGGLSVLSALAFSVWPFLLQGRVGLQGSAEGRWSRTVRMGLAAAELGIAVILTVGAGLMIRSFAAMSAPAPGFEPARVLVLRLSLAGAGYQEKARAAAVVGEVESAMRTLPGVMQAGVAERQSYLLQKANSATPHVVDRFDESLVTPEYFGALGMRLVRGRWLTEGDGRDAAVINETLARRVFGTEDPIGRSIQPLGRPVRVVGVAADLQYSQRDQPVHPELFRGYAQNLGGRPALQIVLRTGGDPQALAAAAKGRLAAIAPLQAIYGVQTLETQLAESIAPRRLHFALLFGFAGISLAMAAIGIYGIVAHSVTQRMREIAIRRALGASGRHILGSVLLVGLSPAVMGIGVGLMGSVGFARWMQSLLYGVEPLDPVTFAMAPLLLVVVATAACLIPAVRAVRIEPMAALRVLLVVVLVGGTGCGRYSVVAAAPQYLLRTPDGKSQAFPDTTAAFSNYSDGWVDLQAGMVVKVDRAYFEPAESRRVRDYVGLESMQLRMEDGGLREVAYVPLAQRPAGQLGVRSMIPVDQMGMPYHRFFFQVVVNRESGAARAVLLSGRDRGTVGAYGDGLLRGAGCGGVTASGLWCTAVPDGAAASLLLGVVANGQRTLVLWGSTVGSLTGKRPPRKLLRAYRGRMLPVVMDAADPEALRLPLLPGDVVVY